MRFFSHLIIIGMLFSTCISAQPNTAAKADGIAEKTKKMKKYAGYFPFYWDENSGEIWLEIDKWQVEFLYMNSLSAGVGSNDIGLDRGQLGSRRIVKFERIGPKVLLVQPNYDFRADTHNPAERQSVEEAFAQSVLWGFKVEAESDGRVLVNTTNFFLRDGHGVSGSLKNSGQGNFSLDPSRSAFYLPRTKNFPKNSEFEVMLTFTGDNPGRFVQSVVPTPEAITVRQHYSFIELPDGDYQPRKFDPRAGYFGISYLDYSAHIHDPMRQQFIGRHRLKKKDPTAAMSEAVEPIVYYLDNGTPEPVRSALLEGAQWWNQAFEAAGFKDAFQVKILPEDADPMDVRYNIIQWVHRSTRGWSYGDGVMDPRTGEIIKGHVTLGSLRVRQDYMIAEGLLAPYESGKTASAEMQAMALARLRQLSAHEIGHTIGLMHNFLASTNNRASVMDYPHPMVKIDANHKLDLSDAYATGIGEWDKIAVEYGYREFPEGTDEDAALEKIIQRGIAKNLVFISDQDARPAGGAHPGAHLWDNGKDAVKHLEHVLIIREIALNQFSEKNIPIGTPMAFLEETLVPIYFFHRYQIEAAAKVLGGLDYRYTLRGDGQPAPKIVSPEKQKTALKILLKTLEPKTLALPQNVLKLIPPRPFGTGRSREVINLRTGPAFDPLAAAEAAASMTLRMLLHPARAARLVEFHSRDKDYPGLDMVLDALIDATLRKDGGDFYKNEIQRAVNSVVLYHLMALAKNGQASAQTKALIHYKLRILASNNKWLMKGSQGQRAHRSYLVTQINKFLKNPEGITLPEPLPSPAGSPIGNASFCNWGQ